MTPEQVTKAVSYNREAAQDGELTVEMAIRLVEFWQSHHDLTEDGIAGPMTQTSIQTSIDAEWSKPVSAPVSPGFKDGKWDIWDGPESNQPTRSDANKFFGNPETAPGSDIMSKAWYKSNIVECHAKHGNALPGAPAGRYIKVHRKVEPYLREALRRAQISCPEFKITKLGDYNFRHIRRNPDKPLSTHSYGIAVDVNPQDNSAITFNKGKSPKAWTPEYFRYWPKSVPEAFVQAFTSCGFAWGSDWNEDGKTDDHTFLDPMHFEWIARDGHRDEV